MYKMKEAALSQFTSHDKTYQFYSLPALEKKGFAHNLSALPVCIRIILESVLRNMDGERIQEEHAEQLVRWQAQAERTQEIPFVVSRVVLQDFTGVPLLVDLAAMRSVANKKGMSPALIEPLVPVDLVVDHSVTIDHYGTPDALRQNMENEFHRNRERYQFMKWGMQAFNTFKVVPPGTGIIHQINLEYLFRGVHLKDGICYPDTLVGTDSHTTMISGAGVVGWGVGGIEAEASMLGQPVYILTPDVIGVELTGSLKEGVTATDLVLTITQMLRKEKVVGKLVEFFGAGTASLTVTDRATIANMAPEYGATTGFFPVDEKTVDYMRLTGKTDEECQRFQDYFTAQGLFGIPSSGQITYTKVLTLDLSSIEPSLAGPKRPQDRIKLSQMKENFDHLFVQPVEKNGFNQTAEKLTASFPTNYENITLKNGDVLIAAITSCTNTSNPGVMIAAGLLARKARAKGLTVQPHIKTSLAPGSRVVARYLSDSGLQEDLDALGFALAGFGCTTCIGNAGDLRPAFNEAIVQHDIVAAAVLSGNRNFEARIHPNIRANFLASPPLVVAFAIAGNVRIDMDKEPLGQDQEGNPVYLKDIWPTNAEIESFIRQHIRSDIFLTLYKNLNKDNDLWEAIPSPTGETYNWPTSTYIAEPPFFTDFAMSASAVQPIQQARALLILGDSVTTDHISPAGSFKPTTPAGKWLLSQQVQQEDFNSYGSRRGHHEVMMRGTFANVRIKNLMLPPLENGSRIEGGWTLFEGKGEKKPVYDVAMRYIQQNTPTIVIAGEEYGTGSSRDWAAKGTQLLGVKAVIAKSFERIHRSNLIGMGVLPLQFQGTDSASSLKLTGRETFDLPQLSDALNPQQELTLTIHYEDGSQKDVSVLCRLDTPIEVAYYKNGGILCYVLRQLLSKAA